MTASSLGMTELSDYPLSFSPLGRVNGVEVDLLRLDQIDPVISGNKWFKLKFNLQCAFREGFTGVMSFGGPHSNHLHALASAGDRFGFPTLGWVRGWDDSMVATPTLSDCYNWGMRLQGLSYGDYRKRYDRAFCDQLQSRYPEYRIIPEGGSNGLGVWGMAELMRRVFQYTQTGDSSYQGVVCPVGSGGTLAGILLALATWQFPHVPFVLGVSALKGLTGRLERSVEALVHQGREAGRGLGGPHDGFAMTLDELPSWSIAHGFHQGGFGLSSAALKKELAFWQAEGVAFDPVYTGKMMMAIREITAVGEIIPSGRLLAIHTGGLQGVRAGSAASHPE